MTQCDLKKINNLPNASSGQNSNVKENKKDTNPDEYEDITSDCPALQRVKLVLYNFRQMTDKLPSTNNVYPCSMHNYFGLFPGYATDLFLNDIDHVLKHQLKHPNSCDRGGSCIHLQRGLMSRKCKTLDLEKQFFNTDNQNDFLYISMLDRAHCLLKHSDDIAGKMDKTTKLLADDMT
eukprot:154407_1